jgi:hypothetical protein
VKGIKAAKLKRIRVPLPPLAEQQRIVAKVNALMDVCYQLETQLAATRSGSRRLLDVALRDALSTANADSRISEPHALDRTAHPRKETGVHLHNAPRNSYRVKLSH